MPKMPRSKWEEWDPSRYHQTREQLLHGGPRRSHNSHNADPDHTQSRRPNSRRSLLTLGFATIAFALGGPLVWERLHPPDQIVNEGKGGADPLPVLNPSPVPSSPTEAPQPKATLPEHPQYLTIPHETVKPQGSLNLADGTTGTLLTTHPLKLNNEFILRADNGTLQYGRVDGNMQALQDAVGPSGSMDNFNNYTLQQSTPTAQSPSAAFKGQVLRITFDDSINNQPIFAVTGTNYAAYVLSAELPQGQKDAFVNSLKQTEEAKLQGPIAYTPLTASEVAASEPYPGPS